MLLNNHQLSFLSLGGFGAGMGPNPAAAKYGRNHYISFVYWEKLFISANCVVTTCCYCSAPGYGGFSTHGNAAGKYGE